MEFGSKNRFCCRIFFWRLQKNSGFFGICKNSSCSGNERYMQIFRFAICSYIFLQPRAMGICATLDYLLFYIFYVHVCINILKKYFCKAKISINNLVWTRQVILENFFSYWWTAILALKWPVRPQNIVLKYDILVISWQWGLHFD